VGGISLWLSYPGIAHEDCYAVRLDSAEQLSDLRLITVPLDSRIGLRTEMAHEHAPNSAFFRPWCLGRRAETLECARAVRRGDWQVVGQLAELDSIRLHGVTMSGSREHKLFAWEPENIPLFRLCNELRDEGAPVYFSTDTGPTTVLFTHRDHEEHVVSRLLSLDMGLEIIRGGTAGPAELVDVDLAREVLGS
jgi:diphosphomevalonate decarboxylase